jgi:OOP family OmpA-OmpF porin
MRPLVLTLVGLVTASTLFLAACGGPTRPTSTILIGVTATANEPAVTLTTTGVDTLRSAVNAGETRLVVYQAGAGSTTTLLDTDLTVRRDRDREHDKDLRAKGFEAKLASVGETLSRAAGTSGALDLFGLLADMARRPGPATLLVHSSGLQTIGQLDLRQGGSDFDVDETLAALPPGALPLLTDKRVIFAGLGQAAGAQKPLTESMRGNVVKLWLGVCAKFNAASCSVDTEPVAGSGPVSTSPVPTLEVPDLSSLVVGGKAPGQDRTETILLPVAVLFRANTADLVDGGASTLQGIAAKITSSRATVTVVGHTATYGPRAGALALSERRSQKVVDTLVSLGVDRTVFTDVRGVGFDEPLEPDLDSAGHLIPRAAERNRTVVLTLYPEQTGGPTR